MVVLINFFCLYCVWWLTAPYEKPVDIPQLCVIPDFPIDLVFMYVATPDASEWENIMEACPDEPGGIQRFRDIGVFRVALKYAERNLPWIRHIFVVTNGVNLPTWLTKNTRITLITHRDIFYPDHMWVLPVYANTPVEAHLHRIPGLAEHFVLSDDDMIFLKHRCPTDFFTLDGRPLFFSDNRGLLADWRVEKAAYYFSRRPILRNAWLSHMPAILLKSAMRKLHKRYPGEYEQVATDKCRHACVSFTFAYNWYMITAEDAQLSPVNKFMWGHRDTMTYGRWHFLRLITAQRFFSDARLDDIDILCINDDFGDGPEALELISVAQKYLADIDF